jgi:hypothetical protein
MTATRRAFLKAWAAAGAAGWSGGLAANAVASQAAGPPDENRSTAASAAAPAGDTPPAGFVLQTWAPLKGNGFRVNSPTVPPQFRSRWEGKQTGRLALALPHDPAACRRAELYLELWGGHPGTAGKRFTVNGHGPYDLPEVGSAAGHCTYSYPTVRVDRGHLRQGENVFQFTCADGGSFWPHYLIRAACLRLAVGADHPQVAAAGLRGFAATVRAAPDPPAETVTLALVAEGPAAGRVAAVEYRGRYTGFDENGSGRGDDWHGFTKDREPVGIVGRAEAAPFAAAWDLAMVPDQQSVAARAAVHFAGADGLTYETPATDPIPMPRRRGRVTLHYPSDMPKPFWSRDGKARACTIPVAAEPKRIARAALHVAIWDGGRGRTAEPFTLNGRPLEVAGAGRHDMLYRPVAVDPSHLRRGENEVRVLAETEHHGIEVLLPGPALVVRTRG